MAFDLIGIIAVGLELLGGLLWVLVAILVADLAIVTHLVRGRRPLPVASAVRILLPVAVLVAVVAGALLPAWTGVSFGYVTSLIDYLAIFGGGIAIGVAAGVLLYPPVQWLVAR